MRFFKKYSIEDGKNGKKLVLKSKWHSSIKDAMLKENIYEIELNKEKGFKTDGNLDFLSEIEFIRGLIVSDFTIKDVSGIKNLKNLLYVDLLTYCDTEIDFTCFPNIESCSIEWKKNSSSIFELQKLKELYIDNFSEHSSEKFRNLCNLESLTIINSKLTEIVNLQHLSKLQELVLSGSKKIQTLKGIENLFNLQFLDIEDCTRIESLQELDKLKELRKLNISNIKKIVSLSPLKNLTKLETLYFYESTDVADGKIKFLKQLSNLKDVRFKNRKHYDSKREEFPPWNE